VPALDGGDAFVGIGGPGEGLGLLVVLGEEAVDGGLEIDDGSEDTILEPAARQDGEEALDRVQPGTGRRREVEGPARMAIKPGPHLVVLVGSVIVEDDVNELAGRDVALEGVEEADELLVPMALHVAGEHRAGQDIERRKQGGGSMALVVVGHSSTAPFLYRQPRLSPLQGLNLALLVHAQDNGLVRRVEVQSHDIGELLGEVPVT